MRAAAPKLKTVFAPSRVSVWSIKVSSARESVPVRTAVPSRTASFTAAGRAVVCAASSRTSWITSVTRACFCCAAKRTVAMPTAAAIKVMAATRFEFGRGVLIRLMSILSRSAWRPKRGSVYQRLRIGGAESSERAGCNIISTEVHIVGRNCRSCRRNQRQQNDARPHGPRSRASNCPFHVALKFRLERDRAADVPDVVIEYVLVRIAVRERTDRADRQPVGQAISGRGRNNLAHIRPAVLVIIARHHSADCVDREGGGQVRGVTEVAFVIVAAWKLMIGAHADVCVHSDRKLLGAAEPEWQLGAKDQRVIREKFVTQAIVRS